MNISIEIVPRSETYVQEELERVQAHLPRVTMVNIPDLLRFPLRSWRACGIARTCYPRAVPHIRAVDFNPEAAFEIAEELDELGLDTLLIVSGDIDRTSARKMYPTNSVDLIRRLKQELPHLTIYAGIDPYRSGLQDEYRYAQEKREAGATGFFTQPFFDLRLMEIYAEMLSDTEIYWGASPVTTQRSMNYWETVNRTVFPRDFAPTLEWNREFARQLLAFAEAHQGHVYFMPIRVGVIEYLQGIL